MVLTPVRLSRLLITLSNLCVVLSMNVIRPRRLSSSGLLSLLASSLATSRTEFSGAWNLRSTHDRKWSPRLDVRCNRLVRRLSLVHNVRMFRPALLSLLCRVPVLSRNRVTSVVRLLGARPGARPSELVTGGS